MVTLVKKFLVFFLACMNFSGIMAKGESDKQMDKQFENKKVAIVYFSHRGETYGVSSESGAFKGNTESLAEKLQNRIKGAKIFRLEVKDAYPTNYDEMINFVKKQQEHGQLPELVAIPDISEFDMIFVGTPVWWGKMSLPVEAFLKSEACRSKIIIPFITHEGSGESGIGRAMKEISHCEKVLPSLVIQGTKVNEEKSDSTIKSFLEKLPFH